MAVRSMAVGNGPTVRPPVLLLLAALLRTAQPSDFTLDTALPWVLGNTPASAVPVPRLFGMGRLFAAFSRMVIYTTSTLHFLAFSAINFEKSIR